VAKTHPSGARSAPVTPLGASRGDLDSVGVVGDSVCLELDVLSSERLGLSAVEETDEVEALCWLVRDAAESFVRNALGRQDTWGSLLPVDRCSATVSRAGSPPQHDADDGDLSSLLGKPAFRHAVCQQLDGLCAMVGTSLPVSFRGDDVCVRIDSMADARGSAVLPLSPSRPGAHAAAAYAGRFGRMTSFDLDLDRAPQMPPDSVLATSSVDAVVGLDEAVAELSDIVRWSLVQPELCDKFGVSVVSGVMIHGPPGTGKTQLVRHVADVCDVELTHLSAAELFSQGSSFQEIVDEVLAPRSGTVGEEGESDRRVILFVDNVDAIASSRNSRSEGALVRSLLSQFDRLSRKAQPPRRQVRVLVVAATAKLEQLDPELRGPGRFERVVELAAPDARARGLILRQMLRDSALDLSDEDFYWLGNEATRGFVGADLAALCREAASACLARTWFQVSPQSEQDAEGFDGLFAGDGTRPALASFKLIREDFAEALAVVRPSALATVVLDITRVRWDDIGGQTAAKSALQEMVEWPLRHADAFARMGVSPPRGVLLYGPPGCSKTLLAKALATESQVNFLAIKGPEVFSKWVGESEKAVRSIFEKARMAAPSVVFIDEIDSIGAARGGAGSDVHSRVLTQLLQEMDGLASSKRVCVVAATNRPDRMDAALLRPGRFDRCIHVRLPDLKDRCDVWRVVLSPVPHSLGTCSTADELCTKLAELTEGLSGAEIANCVREASMQQLALDVDSVEISAEMLLTVATETSPTINPELLRYFEGFERRHGAGF
jgi:transitional endoplasmic reticulum ATPase